MGKWWKCSACSWFSLRGPSACSGCGQPFQQLTDHAPTSPEISNRHGYAIARPWNGWKHGEKSVHARRGRWGRGKQEVQEVKPPADGEDRPLIKDAVNVEVDEGQLTSIKAQMETLDGVISSLGGRSDPVAMQWMEAS